MIIQYAVKPLVTVNSYRFTCDKSLNRKCAFGKWS